MMAQAVLNLAGGSIAGFDLAGISELTRQLLIEEHFYNNLINPVEFYHVPQPATQADSMEVMRLLPPDIDNIAYRLGIGKGGLPVDFALGQNFPNPFNPITEIEFALPKACDVKLEIFNIMGQRVSTLVDGYREAGYHRVIWDGSSVASGLYLYRMQAETFVQTKKMVLLK